MKRPVFLVVVSVAAAVLVGGCGGSGDGATASAPSSYLPRINPVD